MKINPLTLPGNGISAHNELLEKIQLIRAAGHRLVLIDTGGELASLATPDRGDFLVTTRKPSPKDELEASQCVAGWSIFGEQMTDAELKAFAEALLPDDPSDDLQLLRLARQLLVDVTRALEASSSPTHAELARCVRRAPIEELSTLLNGRPSSNVIHRGNALHADAIRATAAGAVEMLPGDLASTLRVSVKNLPHGSAAIFSGNYGRAGTAIAALAAAQPQRDRAHVVFMRNPGDRLPWALERMRAKQAKLPPLRLAKAAFDLAQVRFNAAADRLVSQEQPLPGWSPPRAGAKPLRVGGCELLPHSETSGIVVLGAPGTGKSVGMMQILDQARDHNWPAIVYDPAGDFTRRYYDPSRGDVILSPVDERSPTWNLGEELKNSFDLDKVAAALIEEPTGGEKFWALNARVLLRDIMKSLLAKGSMTNKELYHAVAAMPLQSTVSKELIDKFTQEGLDQQMDQDKAERYGRAQAAANKEPDLAELLSGTQAAQFLSAVNTATGIRTELAARMAVWFYLKDGPNPFSITEFVREPRGRFLFLQSRGDMKAMMRPLISLWMELAVAAQLSLTPDAARRMWFSIDELPSLQKLDSLKSLIAEGRKFGSCVMTGVQLVSQLHTTYGREAGETMLGLNKTIIALHTKEPTSVDYCSKAFGNTVRTIVTRTRNISANDDRDQVSYAEQRQKEALLIEGDFIALPDLTGYMASPKMPAVKVSFVPSDRKPGGNDAWRDEQGFPLGYAMRQDVSMDHMLKTFEAARAAAASSQEAARRKAKELKKLRFSDLVPQSGATGKVKVDGEQVLRALSIEAQRSSDEAAARFAEDFIPFGDDAQVDQPAGDDIPSIESSGDEYDEPTTGQVEGEDYDRSLEEFQEFERR